ncbi:MAG: DUF2520 domain-containing protein [Flavipsychrobacter sp.]
MNFNIIGTGNIAWFFAERLTQAGHQCIGVYGRNKNNAKQLTDSINSSIIENISDIDDSADCCFLAVSDNAIKDIAHQLSFQHTILVHTAGSVKREVLTSAAPHNAVIWPIYSINKQNIPQHKDIPIAIEVSDDKVDHIISGLISSITDQLFSVSSEQRSWLHLSAVLSNNFTNHLLAISEQICKEQELPFAALYPIIHQTVERLQTQSPYSTQTGPAIRKDMGTIKKHMDMLSSNTSWQKVYESITTSIDNSYSTDKEDKPDK